MAIEEEVVFVVEDVAMLALHEEALEKGICDVLKKQEKDNKNLQTCSRW